MFTPQNISTTITTKTSLHRVRGQHVRIRCDILWPLIIPPSPKPKQRHEQRRAARQETGVVHRRRRDGHGIREAENHHEDGNVQAGDGVDDEPQRARHPEPAGRHLGASAQHEVRQDGGEVGYARQDDEGADEGVEGGLRSNVDAGEDGGDDGAEEDGVERVAVPVADATEDAGEGGRVVAGQSPEGAAGGEVAAEERDDVGQDGDDEQADGAARGAGRLLIDGGEGEEEGAFEDGVEVGDAVEDGDEVGEACDEADDELGEDGFGDVLAWPGGRISQRLWLLLRELRTSHLGISSARWVTTSGVPTE